MTDRLTGHRIDSSDCHLRTFAEPQVLLICCFIQEEKIGIDKKEKRDQQEGNRSRSKGKRLMEGNWVFVTLTYHMIVGG